MPSDTQPATVVSARPRRRPRLLPVVVLVLLLVVGAEGVLLSLRLSWHTYTSKQTSDTGAAFAVDYLDGRNRTNEIGMDRIRRSRQIPQGEIPWRPHNSLTPG